MRGWKCRNCGHLNPRITAKCRICGKLRGSWLYITE